MSFFQVSPYLIIFLTKNTPSAFSFAVERVFSKGRLLISHIRNCLSAQSTRALLCLGYWSKLDYIMLDDLKAAASLPDAKNDEDWSDDDWSIVA